MSERRSKWDIHPLRDKPLEVIGLLKRFDMDAGSYTLPKVALKEFEDNRKVSMFIGNLMDAVYSLNLGGTPFSATSIQSLIDNNPTIFWKQRNPNNQWDLCFWLDNAVSVMTAQFVSYGDNSLYGLQTEDFDGTDPKTRCPQCP